jgi:hypothetical protein
VQLLSAKLQGIESSDFASSVQRITEVLTTLDDSYKRVQLEYVRESELGERLELAMQGEAVRGRVEAQI